MAWRDDVRRAKETLDWIEQRQGPLPSDGYARIQTTVGQVRAMAEQDDARIAEIRALHFENADDPDVCYECGREWPCDEAYVVARLDALDAERDALLSELTSYRLDFNVSESHPRLRLREPEYFEADGHRYEKTATCRCCDERYAWGWVGDDGICLHCVDGRADLRTERDALAARLAAAESALRDVDGALFSISIDLVNRKLHYVDREMARLRERVDAALAGSREQAGEGA